MKQRPGIPQAVSKSRPSQSFTLDPQRLRDSWTLDLLAFARHGLWAKKLDMHGVAAAMPPVILNTPDRVIALDLYDSVYALRSRPRAFSQQAGRYSPLVLGAQDNGKKLAIELWSLHEEPTESENNLAEALAKYLQADITLHGPAQMHAHLKSLVGKELPEEIRVRNPLAWLLGDL